MRKSVVRALALGCASLASFVVGCGGTEVRPPGRDPEVIAMTGSLGNRFVHAGESNEVLARLHIDASAVRGAHRPPINLAVVIDTSGSMTGAPIGDARAATRALLSQLEAGDRLAVVAFSSSTEVLLPSTVIDSHSMDELGSAIDRMEASGTTDLRGGLTAGLEEVVRHWDPTGVNRVVLLSDGVPNDPSGIEAMAQAAGERSIAITALGLGVDYDETLLGAIAQRSGGGFHAVEDSSAVASVFREEVLRLVRTVARGAYVELSPGPGVSIVGVVGPATSQYGNSVRVEIGDLSEGDGRDVLVRMQTQARREGATVELLDAVLHFDDAVDGAGSLERRLFLGAHATGSEEEFTSGRDTTVEHDAARLMAAEVTIRAIALARTGNVEEARAVLAQAAAQTEQYATLESDAQMAERAASMRVLDGYLPSMAAGSTGAAPATPAAVYEMHDEAMSVIQGY
ncbi:MAG: VWA domain-containing protein [Sandaracinus sp.]